MTATTPILVTGATGYVGARLVSRLESEGRQVRCLARRPDRLAGRVAPTTEILAGDLLAPESLVPAMRDVRVAYYLVHSMDTAGNFAELDRHAATNFAGPATPCPRTSPAGMRSAGSCAAPGS
jgi:uncharacterized protein YbjT (DUF2867 family)